ncbi:cupredoxin domain-containing protein [Tessaracoccus sp. Y36]
MKLLSRLVVAFLTAVTLVACGAPASAPPQTIELEITDPPGATQRIEVALGAEVTMRITTAIADHAHLHGYELEEFTEPGQTIEWTFTADMAGSYELESHTSDSIWADVVVS